MPLKYLLFRTFVHVTESEEKVSHAMKEVTGLDELGRTNAQGYHGNPLVILHGELRRRKDIKRVFSKMGGEDIEKLLLSLNERVDADSRYHMSLDKQKAYMGRLKLASDEDVIRIKGAIVSYPKDREAALSSMEEFLRSFLATSRTKN